MSGISRSARIGRCLPALEATGLVVSDLCSGRWVAEEKDYDSVLVGGRPCLDHPCLCALAVMEISSTTLVVEHLSSSPFLVTVPLTVILAKAGAASATTRLVETGCRDLHPCQGLAAGEREKETLLHGRAVVDWGPCEAVFVVCARRNLNSGEGLPTLERESHLSTLASGQNQVHMPLFDPLSSASGWDRVRMPLIAPALTSLAEVKRNGPALGRSVGVVSHLWCIRIRHPSC